MTERIATRTTICWLDDEGFVRSETRENAEVTLEDAREASRAAQSLLGGVPRPMLADITELRSISRDARRLTAAVVGERYTAIAVVVASPMSRALGNFFLSLHKPPIPTRMFSSVEEGLAWLRQRPGKP